MTDDTLQHTKLKDGKQLKLSCSISYPLPEQLVIKPYVTNPSEN